MPVATTQLVTLSFVVIVPCGAPQLVQVFFKGGWAYITHHGMPFWHHTCVFDTLEMWGGAIVMGVVDAETPPTILPQGAIPFGVVGFFITTLEAVREGGVLSLPFALVLWYGTQLEAIFSFDIAPLIFGWSLRCVDM